MPIFSQCETSLHNWTIGIFCRNGFNGSLPSQIWRNCILMDGWNYVRHPVYNALSARGEISCCRDGEMIIRNVWFIHSIFWDVTHYWLLIRFIISSTLISTIWSANRVVIRYVRGLYLCEMISTFLGGCVWFSQSVCQNEGCLDGMQPKSNNFGESMKW